MPAVGSGVCDSATCSILSAIIYCYSCPVPILADEKKKRFESGKSLPASFQVARTMCRCCSS